MNLSLLSVIQFCILKILKFLRCLHCKEIPYCAVFNGRKTLKSRHPQMAVFCSDVSSPKEKFQICTILLSEPLPGTILVEYLSLFSWITFDELCLILINTYPTCDQHRNWCHNQGRGNMSRTPHSYNSIQSYFVRIVFVHVLLCTCLLYTSRCV